MSKNRNGRKLDRKSSKFFRDEQQRQKKRRLKIKGEFLIQDIAKSIRHHFPNFH